MRGVGIPLKVTDDEDDPPRDTLANEGNVTQSMIEVEASLPPFEI